MTLLLMPINTTEGKQHGSGAGFPPSPAAWVRGWVGPLAHRWVMTLVRPYCLRPIQSPMLGRLQAHGCVVPAPPVIMDPCH